MGTQRNRLNETVLLSTKNTGLNLSGSKMFDTIIVFLIEVGFEGKLAGSKGVCKVTQQAGS